MVELRLPRNSRVTEGITWGKPSETTEEEPQSENNDQSSNNDDDNNNR